MFSRLFSLLALLLGTVLLLQGCNPYNKTIPTGTPFEVTNVYTNPSYNYNDLLNVVLLPIDNPLNSNAVELYSKSISLVTLSSFGKFHYFNLQSAEDLKETSSHIINLDTGVVDRALLGAVAEDYHAQAVMQISVTDLRVFPPMRMHVKAALFDATTGTRIWQVEEVFDTEDSTIFNGMRYWWNTDMAGTDEFNRFSLQSLRPSFFLNYVMHSLADSYGRSRSNNVQKIELEKKLSKRNKPILSSL